MDGMELALLDDDEDDFGSYDAYDGYGGMDTLDFEDENEDEEADEWGGAFLSGLAGLADTGYRRYSANRTKQGRKVSRGWDAAAKGLLSGLRVAGNALMSEAADLFEPEYETDAIDAMEVVLEDALDPAADETDASLAADEMTARSFGMMRGAPQIRPIMAALAGRARKLIMRARRDPRLRNAAQLAPLAMRRTAIILMRLTAARRPISPALAIRIFGSILSRLMRSHQTRRVALTRARMRARRGRATRGYARPQSRPHPTPRSRRSAGY